MILSISWVLQREEDDGRVGILPDIQGERCSLRIRQHDVQNDQIRIFFFSAGPVLLPRYRREADGTVPFVR